MRRKSTEVDPHARLADLVERLPEAERGVARAALDQARQTAAALEAQVAEITYVASHDLTEPLRMVTSYLRLLDRCIGQGLDDRTREFMFYAVDGAERMQALLDDLLRYSRMQTTGLEASVVCLDTLLDEVLRGLGPAVDEAEATVRGDGGLPVVVGDRGQLRQLLQDLVANAVKFRPPERGNAVLVTATRSAEAPGWELVVTDDGIGVPVGQTERIWGVFRRLHGPEEYAGNGIGLPICRRIAERHGGRIWHTAPARGGSAFHVLLPDEVART